MTTLLSRPSPVAARPPARSVRARAAAGLAAGLLLEGAFPPLGGWPLAVAGVAVLALAVRGATVRGGAVAGLLCGLGLFVPLLHWSGTIAGPAAWLLLAVAESLFVAALGAALAAVSRLPGWPVWGAALWVGQEALRDRLPFGGFPWGRLAFSQARGPLLPLAALGGAPLLTAGVALLGGALAAVLVALGRRRAAGSTRAHPGPAVPWTQPEAAGSAGARPGPAVPWTRREAAGSTRAHPGPAVPRRSALADVGLPLVLAAAAVLAAVTVPVPATADSGTVRVALVQGNVPRLGLDAFDQTEAVLRNHVAATHGLAADVRAGRAPRPDLVLWPENASDLDPYRDPLANALITEAVRDVGVPVLVGAVVAGPGRKVSNTGIVWDPATGPGATYVKQHPVPFGEYMPYRDLLRKVTSKVDLVPRDFAAGTRTGVLQVGPARVGDVICFEVAYDGLVRDAVRGGGRAIVVQTNNATFGHSAETSQQLAMSRLRAVEHGRAVLVASTSGISAVVQPDGRVSARAGVFRASVLQAQVPLRSAQTLATRLGALPELAMALAGAAALVVALARSRRA